MSTTQNTIGQIHTSCKDCAFALYKNNTQYDCAMNMLDTYKNKQTEIIEAYDDDKEFYVINGKKCISYRTEKWFTEFDDYVNNIDYKIQKTKESNNINYIMIIDLKNFTVDKLERMMQDIDGLNVKPKRLILIRYNYLNKVFDFDIVKKCLDILSTKIPWKLQTMVDDVELRSILSSTIITYKSHRFMLYINDYCDKILEMVDKANNIAFKDLGVFELITDQNKRAYLFSVLVYRHSWSMEGKDILNLTNNENQIII